MSMSLAASGLHSPSLPAHMSPSKLQENQVDRLEELLQLQSACGLFLKVHDALLDLECCVGKFLNPESKHPVDISLEEYSGLSIAADDTR